jgi:hypothetical protein
MFIKNLVHDNIEYGIDPHSGTHDMYITYNKVYNNNHGIICSVKNLVKENAGRMNKNVDKMDHSWTRKESRTQN